MRYIITAILLTTFSLLLLLVALFYIAIDIKKNNVFVLTGEWQIVRKNTTPIFDTPEIEHDLQTNVHEEKVSTNETKMVKGLNESQTNSFKLYSEKALSNKKNSSRQEEPFIFFKLFNKFQGHQSDLPFNNTNISEEFSVTRKPLTNNDELLNTNVFAGSKELLNLFNEFESCKKSLTSSDVDALKIKKILNKLEDYVHDIDNARTFSKMGGMIKIISPSLNSSNDQVKVEALNLLGAAVQLNPDVQLKALKCGFVQKILNTLSNNNNSILVKSKCLFALGALVRQFPAAQKAFIKNGGFKIFEQILANSPFLIQIRVMKLINDLTIEYQNIKYYKDENQNTTRVKEYNSTDFEEKLRKQKYCHNLVDLVARSLESNDESDFFYEVLYESMSTLSFICKNELVHQTNLIPLIQKKLNTYKESLKSNNDRVNVSFHLQKSLEKILFRLKFFLIARNYKNTSTPLATN